MLDAQIVAVPVEVAVQSHAAETPPEHAGTPTQLHAPVTRRNGDPVAPSHP